jgi:hypothetical protein
MLWVHPHGIGITDGSSHMLDAVLVDESDEGLSDRINTPVTGSDLVQFRIRDSSVFAIPDFHFGFEHAYFSVQVI